TFDAGYENGNVEKILDVLKEEGVPGAFFILDNLILRNEALVRRMGDEGHLVCNHTLRHRDMTRVTDEAAFLKELTALEDLYRERCGREMAKYYRPPEGRFNEENLKMAQKNGYKTIFWSIAYADWDNDRQPSCDAAVKKLLDNTHNGAIVLLHPTSSTNAAILPTLIKAWRAEGYRFGTLDELVAKRETPLTDAAD
ncbi:MAG: polysaccharide deacetylase family protein, partial [Clostridia bacterium]|nr:polysaccharide deacetylase family protein [Clostridia bacterium]